ncbi:MAG TPA: ATP-binding cassette domain-containing protein, partial [Thermoanaerobaculia bacterium]|nr:ATP-binding cassette domain-containing protein [Thermoanaerobaculia bacterium]
MNDFETGPAILQARNVDLTLGGNHILAGVNLTVNDIRRPGRTTGQVVGLLGPSGVGKTRLFRILAGLDAPDSGAVLIGDPPKPVERGMVGVVAQSYPLFAHRSVLSNLELAGKLAGLSDGEAKAKAFDYLKRFGIEDRAKLFPIQLSGGQRQRVAIAQQFMSSGHFLLLDEPFS